MADIHVNLGGTIDAGVAANIIRFDQAARDRRGSILNLGPSRIYLGFNMTDVNANETQESDKIWVDVNKPVRLPSRVEFVAFKTASGAAKAHYVED